MRKLLLIIVTVIPVMQHVSAQTIITEMDKVTYYNSLDTGVSATFNKIAWLCNCYILKNYPKSDIPI